VKRSTKHALKWLALGAALGALYVDMQIPDWVKTTRKLVEKKP
jgi:heme/copper-type cytochrome/quinol oxidase subunit 3